RAITTALTPAMSALDARGRTSEIRQMLVGGTRLVLWIIVPVQCGLIFLGKTFLTLWLGERLAALSYPTLMILSIALIFSISQSVTSRMLYATSTLRTMMWLNVAMAIINLLLSIALVNPLGIEGVAWGTTIPAVLANVA